MFFDWDHIFKEFDEYRDVPMWMVLAPRNVGKSTSTYKWALKNGYFTPQKKVLMLRNTDSQTGEMKKDFAARFKDQFTTSGSFVYNTERELWVNRKTKETVEKFKKKDLVGYISAINTYTNLKSVEAKDVRLIFYEEFNEDTNFGKNIYSKFINLITTFQRFSTVKFLMVGNKDCYNNDFFVNWDIQPNENPDEDKITEIRSYDGSEILGVCLDLGLKRFADLGNQNTLSNKLAMLDGRSRNYALGGYAKTIIQNVRNARSFINEFRPIYKIAVLNNNYVFGKVEEDFAIVSPWNWEISDNLPVYAFDKISRTSATSLTDRELKSALKNIIFLFKNNKLIFDSWDTREVFNMMTKLVELKKS